MLPSPVSQKYIIDANVLFSSLISGREFYLKFLADNQIFTSDFALDELQLHQAVVSQRTKLSPEQFEEYTLQAFSRVTIVPNLLISTQNYYQAFMLCRDIDPKDTAYVALSLQLNVTLLTRDKPLVEGLRNKDFTNVITLDELFDQNSADLTN